jgi:hypothetical protein
MDKSALVAMPDTGIRLNLSNFSRIRTWQGGGEFWEHHNQQLIRDSLGQFLPRATVESGNTVLYQHFEGGKELCSLCEPVTAKNPIPHDQAEQLRVALTAFKAKAADPTCDPDSRKLINCFRLPDPKKDPELYRVVGSGRRRRLIVLWGAEKEQDSAISPLEAVNMVHAEPSENSGTGRPLMIAVLAIIVASATAYYFMGGFNDKRGSLTSSEVAAKPGPNGRLVLVSPGSESSSNPAGIGSVEKPDGSPISGPNGKPLAVGGVTDADGKLVQAANGEPLKVGLVTGANGKPDTKDNSGPFVMAPVTGSDGKPLIGKDGKPEMVGLVTGPASDKTVDGKRNVIGPDGKPVMGPDGKPVEAGLLTGPDGKPVIGSDGKQKAVGLISGSDNKPVAIGPVTDAKGKPMTSTDNKPVAIVLGNETSKAKPDDETASKSTVLTAAVDAKPGETDPTKPPGNSTPSEGRKVDPQPMQPDKGERPSANSLPVASTSTESTKTVETKIAPTAGDLTFRAEEIPDKGQQDGKIAVKLLPVFGDKNRNAASATWTINAVAPNSKEVIEESAGAMTLWLAPGTHRIALKAKGASGNSLSAEAELEVQVKTQVQLRTRPTSVNP